MSERQQNCMRKKVPSTFTTKDLINEASERFPDVTKGKMKKICDGICEILGEQIKEKKSIRLNNVGVMRMRTLAVRKGRNPLTGDLIDIPERCGVKFQMCRKLDYFLNKGIDLYNRGDEWCEPDEPEDDE